MKNSIINQYISALNKLIRSTQELTTRQITRNLINDLRLATSSDLVITKFNEILKRPKSEFSISGALHQKLSAWNSHLQQLSDLQKKAITNLDKFNTTSQNKPILSFLTGLLYDEKTSLHTNAGSLFHILNDEKLEDVFTYIQQSQHTPIPKNATPGSFYSIPIVSEDHHHCIQSLCNTVARKDFDNALFSKANTLLQSALMIHHELSLEDEIIKEIESPRGEAGPGCSFM
jgi:hypothetical protein